MISESSRYYGAVLAYLVDRLDGQVGIERAFSDCGGFYLVNKRVPLYVKYSTKRHGPWTFNFQADHLERHRRLFDTYGQCVVAFVCAGDGIVAVGYDDLGSVLSGQVEDQEAVSIRRKLNHMYCLSGRAGEFERKLSKSSLELCFEGNLVVVDRNG